MENYKTTIIAPRLRQIIVREIQRSDTSLKLVTKGRVNREPALFRGITEGKGGVMFKRNHSIIKNFIARRFDAHEATCNLYILKKRSNSKKKVTAKSRATQT